MNDLTFIFPIRIESNERLENIKSNILYLKKIFNNPNIIIAEDGSKNIFDDILKIETNFNDYFYKTKIINNAVKNTKTKFVAIIDADLFFSKDDYEQAFNLIQNNEKDFVFSYNGIFLNHHRSFINYLLENNIKQGQENIEYKLELMNNFGVGGSIWCSKEHFFQIGGQNENMISWGYEDNEFYSRIIKLEKKFYRTSGIAYHINHPRGVNSSWDNPYINKNLAEYQRIDAMNKEQLISEINNWNWNK